MDGGNADRVAEIEMLKFGDEWPLVDILAYLGSILVTFKFDDLMKWLMLLVALLSVVPSNINIMIASYSRVHWFIYYVVTKCMTEHGF